MRLRILRLLLGLVTVWGVAGILFGVLQPPHLLSRELAAIPEMLVNRAWWESSEHVALLLWGIATLAFGMIYPISREKLYFATGGAILCVAIALTGFWILSKSVSDRQSCANCRSFIRHVLKEYSDAHDGWLPRDGRDPLDSLALAITKKDEVHFFSSHAQRRAARDYWVETGSLSESVCCYRYNEGLRADDSSGLVILYYREPGRWECNLHPMESVGRVCLLHPGGELLYGRWEFISEAEFQQAQARTLAYIAKRERDRDAIEAVQDVLRIEVMHASQENGGHRFGVRLRNRAEKELRLEFPRGGSVDVEGYRSFSFCPQETELTLGPNSEFELPWWLELELSFTQDGDAVNVEHRATRESGKLSGSWKQDGVSASELLDRFYAEARAHVRATQDGEKQVEVTLTSSRVYFLKEE